MHTVEKRKIIKESPNASPALKRIKSSDTINHYQGWVVPTPDYQLPVLCCAKTPLDPEFFYQHYIAQRRPVVIKSHHIKNQDNDVQLETKWTNDYLRSKLGNISVDIETRKNLTDSFGQGQETTMPFAQFMDLFERNDPRYYLTTQDVQADDEGRPECTAPLMVPLLPDFPSRPPIMGHLIPQNINLWMGNAPSDGASSGLHHDYHDNLYLVLRGMKHFRLYSPQDTECLYPRGSLERVHANGRINYEGESTLAFGATAQAVAAAEAAKAQAAAEWTLAQAQDALDQNVPGAKRRYEEAEAELERTMDLMLEAEMDIGEGDSSDEEEDSEEQDFKCFETKTELVDQTVKNPSNFSTLPSNLENIDPHDFPLFSQAKAAFCTLKAGDMLYLPASWFHEVTSVSSINDHARAQAQDKSLNGHLALNYWFHPPDGTSFQQPYSSSFWTDDWNLAKKT